MQIGLAFPRLSHENVREQKMSPGQPFDYNVVVNPMPVSEVQSFLFSLKKIILAPLNPLVQSSKPPQLSTSLMTLDLALSLSNHMQEKTMHHFVLIRSRACIPRISKLDLAQINLNSQASSRWFNRSKRPLILVGVAILWHLPLSIWLPFYLLK